MLKEQNKLWYSTKEVAEELRVTTKTLYSLIKSNELKAYRFGKNYKIHPDDYAEYVRNCKEGESKNE